MASAVSLLLHHNKAKKKLKLDFYAIDASVVHT